FQNTGPAQVHQASLVEFPPGTTVDDVNKLFASVASGGQPQGPGPEQVGGGEALDPGGNQTFTATLTRGRVYAFVCFLPDRSGGRVAVRPGSGAPWSWTAIRAPARSSALSRSTMPATCSLSGWNQPSRPTCPAAERAFGPRGTSRARASACRRSSAASQSPAA